VTDNSVAVLAVVTMLSYPMSLFASLAKQEQFPKQLNLLVVMAVAAAGGALVEWMTGGFGHLSAPADYVSCATALFAAMQMVYIGIKDSTAEAILAAFPGRRESSAGCCDDCRCCTPDTPTE
jgi:ABC-type enterochelin transport system permease subunit